MDYVCRCCRCCCCRLTCLFESFSECSFFRFAFFFCAFSSVCIVYRTTIHIILNFNCILPSRARTHTNTLDASNTSMLFGLGQRPAQKLLRSVFFCSEKNIRGSPKTANYLQINYLCSSKMERKRESGSHVISLHNESRVRTLQVHIIYGFEFR